MFQDYFFSPLARKILLAVALVILPLVWVMVATRSYLRNAFGRIETKQEAIVSEIRSLRGGTSPTGGQSSSYDAIQEIEQLKKEVSDLKNQVEESDTILKFTPSVSISPTHSFYEQIKKDVGYVTISESKWAQVDVFQDKSTSSKIVGQAQYGVTYPYSKKEGGYYYIALSPSLSGWIHGQFVRERN